MNRYWALPGDMMCYSWGQVWRVGGCLLLITLLLSACSDTQPPTDTTTPTTSTPGPPATAPTSVVEVRFTDVTTAAGVVFQHEAGASGKKWYPETMGAGGGFFDYDGDGFIDILLINGRRWPGEAQGPEPTMRLYRNQGDGTFMM